MAAFTLDYFSLVDVTDRILLDLLPRDSLSFCVVTCAYFPHGHMYQVRNTTLQLNSCVPHLIRMATREVSMCYYTEGKRVMKKIKKNSMEYINKTEVIQSESCHFKF
jgi:hypothetical protein